MQIDWLGGSIWLQVFPIMIDYEISADSRLTTQQKVNTLKGHITCNHTCKLKSTMTVVINKHRNSILMMHHYPDLGSVDDCLKQIYHVTWPIRSTTQIWVVMSLVWNFYVWISQTSLCRETIGCLAKCRFFSQVKLFLTSLRFTFVC